MYDAVVAEDGISYSERAIRAWAARVNRKSPRTGAPIGTMLVPNHTMRQAVNALLVHTMSVARRSSQ